MSNRSAKSPSQSSITLIQRFFGIKNIETLADSNQLRAILDQIQEGVALYDNDGNLLFSNPRINLAEMPAPLDLRQSYARSETGLIRLPVNVTDSLSVHIVNCDHGFGILTEPPTDRLSMRDKTLRYLMKPMHENENIYARAARALGLASNWEWVGVSRYLDDAGMSVCFEGWWSSVVLEQAFESSTANAACEIVAKTEEFCFYGTQKSLKERFPKWGMVEQFDMHAYAGLVIRRNSLPVGHILAISNRPSSESDLMEDLIRLCCEFVGVQLDMEFRNQLEHKEYFEARTDQLTRLGNRRACEEQLRQAHIAFTDGAIQDALLISIHIDGLEDRTIPGHQKESGSYQNAYANILRKLWRPNDPMFRTADNEFALVLQNVGPEFENLIVDRILQGNRQFANLFKEAGEGVGSASIGIGFLSESGGDIEETVSLVKQRRMQNIQAAQVHEVDFRRAA